MKYFIYIFAILVVAISCSKDSHNSIIMAEDIYLSAGSCTTLDETSNAFEQRIAGLTFDERQKFFVGNSFFEQNWVQAPASTTARDGLGPLMNAKACSACHANDGRGAPFSGNGLLLRLSQMAGGTPQSHPVYGGQFQDFAIHGSNPEGKVVISHEMISGTYKDGTPYTLQKPIYQLTDLNYGPIGSDIMISPRVGPQMIGLGLLEIIPEYQILANVDEFDTDGDGVSGRANYVLNPVNNQIELGRFGWKANKVNLLVQTAAAFNGDIGIKSSIFPEENYTSNQTSLHGLPDGGTIEIDDDDLEKVALYTRGLAVPARRIDNRANFELGRKLFDEMLCSKCHIEEHTTGTSGNIDALKNIKIRPFTDLLIHDMGDGLADNRPDGLANGKEWRTPPLWGIGLIEKVNGHTFYLHDGRARNLEEAILWHGGEAEESKQHFVNAPVGLRNLLINFLKSL